jgi:hypothetical protein
MFKFGEELTLENVLKKVSPYQIFKFYMPKLNVGRATNSPFRKDTNASFGLVVNSETGDIIYNDMRGGDSGNWIKFLMKLRGVDFLDTLRIVNRDMSLGLVDFSTAPIMSKPIKSQIVENVTAKDLARELHLHVQRRKWQQHDADYWLSYGIGRAELGDETYPISSYWFNDWGTQIADKHAYGYDFYQDGDFFRRKIYQPFSETDKWKTNLNTLVIDGIKDIPKEGDLLIITKARKDRLVLKGLDYTAIATNNESSWIPQVNFDKLKTRFDEIVIFFDNDEAGLMNAAKFGEDYDLRHIHIPTDSSEQTDISDFRHDFGELATKRMLKYLL